jgi:putative ABC transport system ATP-binding protein
MCRAARRSLRRAKRLIASGSQIVAHRCPRSFPGGQQQRVAIARALVHDPPLIVCDEPTSALDHATGHLVMEILRAIADDDGRTLIIVTHDPRIFSFADRLAHMDDGRIKKIEQGHRQQTSRHV